MDQLIFLFAMFQIISHVILKWQIKGILETGHTIPFPWMEMTPILTWK